MAPAGPTLAAVAHSAKLAELPSPCRDWPMVTAQINGADATSSPTAARSTA